MTYYSIIYIGTRYDRVKPDTRPSTFPHTYFVAFSLSIFDPPLLSRQYPKRKRAWHQNYLFEASKADENELVRYIELKGPGPSKDSGYGPPSESPSYLLFRLSSQECDRKSFEMYETFSRNRLEYKKDTSLYSKDIFSSDYVNFRAFSIRHHNHGARTEPYCLSTPP